MSLKLSDFDYDLPKDLIAQEPIENRSESRLMVLEKERVEHKRFHDIINYLEEGDVLVVNETKVRRSVFFGKKESGSPAKLVVLKKIEDTTYYCRVSSRSPKDGSRLIFEEFEGTVITNDDGIYTIRFNRNIDDLIEKDGKLLYPDYIKTDSIPEERYQTEYANKTGSLAAPTAGLHFTKELLKRIEEKGVKIAKVCLHVSFGTFLPILTENILDHRMEEEYFEVSEETADLISNARRVFAVGTTSLKAMESASDNSGKVQPIKGKSDLFITPEYRIKTQIDGLITNFHLPMSTLLLLVSSFASKKKIFEAYQIAIENKYRFYSFGDAMLILR